MNDDEPQIEQAPRFSVTLQCPKCRQISLSYRQGKILCQNCGFEEKIPEVR